MPILLLLLLSLVLAGPAWAQNKIPPANMTIIADSGNFQTFMEKEHLTDGDTTAYVHSAANRTTGSSTVASFSITYELKKDGVGHTYPLTSTRLHGDTLGDWQSVSWSLETSPDNVTYTHRLCTGAANKCTAAGSQWFSQSLAVSARYVRVTVHGRVDDVCNPGCTEAREFEVYTSADVGSGVEYFVAKTGSDANSCTQAKTLATAKLTIAAGIACLLGGDTLTIKAGTYVENVTFNAPSGTDGAHTTLQGALGETVWLRPTAQSPFYIFAIQAGRHHITVRNIGIDGSAKCWGNGLWSTTGDVATHTLLFEDIEVKEICGDGVVVRGVTQGLTFRNSYIHDLRKSTANTSPAGGFYVQGKFDVQGQAVNIFENNRLENLTSVGFGVLDAQDVIIRGNILNNVQSGISFRRNEDNVIAYNNIIANTQAGFQSACSGGSIYNNTIYNASKYGVYRSGPQPLCAAVAARIKNNIFYQVGRTDFIPSGNFIGNPNFVNAAGEDFHLQSGSAAANGATTFAQVPFDADCVPRPVGASYSYGAFEESGGTPDATCLGSTAVEPPPPDLGDGADPIADARVNPTLPNVIDATLNSAFLGIASCDKTKINADASTTGTDLAPTDVTLTGPSAVRLVFTPSFVHTEAINLDLTAAFCTNIHGITTDAATDVAVVNNLPDAEDITTGLVLHCAFDETTGTTAECGVTDGTLTNMAGTEWEPAGGQVDGAVHLDGSNDYLTLGTVATFDVASSFTIAAWINLDTFGDSSFGRILDRQVSPTGSGYSFYVNNNPTGTPAGTATLSATIDGTAFAANNTLLTTGTWHHVAVVFDDAADTVTFYVDKNSVGTRAYAGALTSNGTSLKIGDRNDLARSFDGLLDEVRLYNRALTANQIVTLFNITSSEPVPPPEPTLRQTNMRWTSFFAPINSRATDWLSPAGMPARMGQGGGACFVVQYTCTGGDCPTHDYAVYVSEDGGAYTQLADSCDAANFCLTSYEPLVRNEAGEWDFDDTPMGPHFFDPIETTRFGGIREEVTTAGVQLLDGEAREELICVQSAPAVPIGTTAAFKIYLSEGQEFDAYDTQGVPVMRVVTPFGTR